MVDISNTCLYLRCRDSASLEFLEFLVEICSIAALSEFFSLCCFLLVSLSYAVLCCVVSQGLWTTGMRKPRRRCRQHLEGRRSPSPYSLKCSPTRETLTYAQAQRIVEVDIDGRLHRISIYDPLKLITEDELTAQDINECNSNKENSEQPLFTSKSKKTPSKGKKKESCSKHAPGMSLHLPQPKFRVVDSFSQPDAPPLPAA